MWIRDSYRSSAAAALAPIILPFSNVSNDTGTHWHLLGTGSAGELCGVQDPALGPINSDIQIPSISLSFLPCSLHTKLELVLIAHLEEMHLLHVFPPVTSSSDSKRQ
jgi:hypothetical protein